MLRGYISEKNTMDSNDNHCFYIYGCKDTQNLTEQDEHVKENEYNISIQNPIVFSKNSVAIADDKTLYINIEMISGQYVFDEFPGFSG